MITVQVYDKSGKATETMQVDEASLGGAVRYELLRHAVAIHEARQRVGTHATKTKAEVAGSGKKMYRQKHTGMARMGQLRAPHRRGGGMAFGLDSPNFHREIPRAARRAALQSAILSRLTDGELAVFADLEIKEPKTKAVAQYLQKLNPQGGSLLIVTPNDNELFLKSARNIAGVFVRRVRDLNAYDVLRPQRVLFSKAAMQELMKGLA